MNYDPAIRPLRTDGRPAAKYPETPCGQVPGNPVRELRTSRKARNSPSTGKHPSVTYAPETRSTVRALVKYAEILSVSYEPAVKQGTSQVLGNTRP